MRTMTRAAILLLGLSGSALAQAGNTAPPPAAIGNRANGLNYQPTPNQVVPRERSAGVAPSAQQRNANDQDLEKLDRNLLKSEGQTTKSVPTFSSGH